MARYRKKGRRGSHKMTIPVAVVAPIAGLAYAIAVDPVARANVPYIMTGFQNGKLDVNRLAMTYGPMLAGAVIHKAAGYAGINKALGRAKVPLIRV